MNVSAFNHDQKAALLDLLIVGMYADQKLSSAEDARVSKLLDSFAFESDYERQQFCDAAFTRASRQKFSPEAMSEFVGQFTGRFPDRSNRRNVYAILEDLITSDSHISAEENELLAALREAFQL